jgi:hypothetical protein
MTVLGLVRPGFGDGPKFAETLSVSKQILRQH